MLKRYSQLINDAISHRTGEAEMEILSHHPRFLELNDRKNAILKQIGQNLKPELQNLILELDDCHVEQETLAYELMYRQGVKDGFNFRRLLRRCGDM